MWIASAIIVCMVLHLIDHNNQWVAFWTVTKRTAIVFVLLGILGGSYAWYQTDKNARAAMTPDSYMAQHSH